MDLTGDLPDAGLDVVVRSWDKSFTNPHPDGPAAYKQHSWDKQAVAKDLATLTASMQSDHQKAILLAVSAPHSGDWLQALPITACGLRLDDEAIRVAVGLRLGAKLCEPHACPCGAMTNELGTHGLACKISSGRSVRHHNLNDAVWHALTRADIPSAKEPSGLMRTDGKRPDGLTLIPWATGRSLTWDVTVADTLAATYLKTSSLLAGSAAENAAMRKESKYSILTST